MSKDRQYDIELRDLWSRRCDLDEPGWARLYEIVVSVLGSYRPSELAGLPEDHDFYLVEFFMKKVYRLDLKSGCDHAGVLRVAFKRFLVDQLRSKKVRKNIEVADTQHEDDEKSSLVGEAAEPVPDEPDAIDALKEAGLSPEEVAKSAARWLDASEEWVRPFVALSNCPDAEQSEPLVKLAKRKGIKSQAYKAEKLGFNWGKSSHDGFGDTLLGTWIKSLGIEIVPENSLLVLGALKILCLVALSWEDPQEPAA
jgi:hypothetical protein